MNFAGNPYLARSSHEALIQSSEPSARARQVPMGFGGNAWDVANTALYLASDESRYVTGLEFVVDGGITLKYV